MADFYRREIFALGQFLTNMQSYRYQEVYQKFMKNLPSHRSRSETRKFLNELSNWAREVFLIHPPSTLWELTSISPPLANYWLKNTFPNGNYPRAELVLDELEHLPNGFRVSIPLDDKFLWNSVNRLIFQMRPDLGDRLATSPTQSMTINLVLLQTLPDLLVTRKELKQFYGTPANPPEGVVAKSSETSYEWQSDTSPVQQWQFGELLAAGGSSLTFNPAWLKAIGVLEIPTKKGEEHTCQMCKVGGSSSSLSNLTCQRCLGRQTWDCDYCDYGWADCDTCEGDGCDDCGWDGGWYCEECNEGQVNCPTCFELPDEPNECPFKRFELFWGQTVLETLVAEDPALAEATRLEVAEMLFDQVPSSLELLTTGRVIPHLLDFESSQDLINRSFEDSLDSDWILFIPSLQGPGGFRILYLPQYAQNILHYAEGITKHKSNRDFFFNSLGYGFGVGRIWATGWEKAELGKTFISNPRIVSTYSSRTVSPKSKQVLDMFMSLTALEGFQFLALQLRADHGVRALNFPQSS